MFLLGEKIHVSTGRCQSSNIPCRARRQRLTGAQYCLYLTMANWPYSEVRVISVRGGRASQDRELDRCRGTCGVGQRVVSGLGWRV
jgi:hypothetical protein